MKTVLTILISTIVLLLVFIFLGVLELKKEDDLKQVEIDSLKAQNTQQKDLFEKRLDAIRKIQVMQSDSTRYYRLLKTKDQRTVNTKTESHEKIIFVNLNDSARHSKLAKFYRSYKRP